MYAGLGTSAALPMIHVAIYELFFSQEKYSSSMSFIFMMGVSYLVGLYIYTVRWPEKHKPGIINTYIL